MNLYFELKRLIQWNIWNIFKIIFYSFYHAYQLNNKLCRQSIAEDDVSVGGSKECDFSGCW